MITLTDKEIELLDSYVSGDFDLPQGESKEIFAKITEDALALERELNEDSGDDLVAWYYNKYKSQSK